MMTMHVRMLAVSLATLGLGCVMVPNPHADELGGETIADSDSDSETGDRPGEGDGDGESPSDGDGDGDGDGDDELGDGDGDSHCVAGKPGCPCTVLETCDDGLACVLDKCVRANSCEPVDDFVQLSASPSWAGDPPMAPSEPQISICALAGQLQGNQAVLSIQQCSGSSVLQQLVLTIQPVLAPLEQLLGNPNLAATVTVVKLPEGLFVRVEADGMDLFYVDGTSLFADGVTSYPWPIAPYSSACGSTPAGCGELERLALHVDGGAVFDGNAGQPSPMATAWVETLIDECGVLKYEVVLLAH